MQDREDVLATGVAAYIVSWPRMPVVWLATGGRSGILDEPDGRAAVGLERR